MLQPVLIPSSSDTDVLSCLIQMHKVSIYLQCKAVTLVSDELNRQHSLQSKKVPRRVEVVVEWRATHTAFTQEAEVWVPFETKLNTVFLKLTSGFCASTTK